MLSIVTTAGKFAAKPEMRGTLAPGRGAGADCAVGHSIVTMDAPGYFSVGRWDGTKQIRSKASGIRGIGWR